MADTESGHARSASSVPGVLPTAIGLLLAAHALMSLWMLRVRLFDLPWVSGQPGPSTDFVALYTGGWMARHGLAATAYDEIAFQAAQLQVLPGFDFRMLWMHPPPAFFAWTPLAALPHEVAYVVFLATSAGLYAWAGHRIVGHRWAGPAALLFSGWTMDFLYGQSGAVLAVLLATGLSLRRTQPVLAGILLGFLTIKPHWAPVVVIALLAGREWKALGATLAAAGSLYALSAAVFGLDTWAAFLANLGSGFDLIADHSVYDQVSPYSALMHLSPTAASVVQTGCTLAAIAVVAWVWSQRRRTSTRMATVAVALCVASPYLHVYDLAVLGVAVAWLARDAVVQGDRQHALAIFTLASSIIWLFRVVGALFEVQLAPLFLMGGLVFLARRD